MPDIAAKIRAAKRRLLQMHFAQKACHIGSNLSALDAMMVLYHQVMTPQDSFILSKGHSAGALYITLWSIGHLTDEDLTTFHSDNTRLAGHPMAGWSADIPVTTGSLGHGVALAAGIAKGRQLTKTPGHVYCLTSDGEWQEGSNWEALIFFAHHHLTNLTVLVDCNGLQGFGTTEEIASMTDLAAKIAAFNVPVEQVNGQDPVALNATLQNSKGKVIILNTIKGAGVSFMENRMEWHYLSLNAEQLQQALAELTDPEQP